MEIRLFYAANNYSKIYEHYLITYFHDRLLGPNSEIFIYFFNDESKVNVTRLK